nr:hypothetical protein [Tanacetum cinerariifolium]
MFYTFCSLRYNLYLSKPQVDCSIEVPENSENLNPTAFTSNPLADQIETLTAESLIPTVSSQVPTACITDSLGPSSDARLISKRVANQVETPSLNNILTLINRFEDILIGTTNFDESNGVEADVSNMEITITASPTPTLRIHKDHPKSQIIGPVDTPIQTKNKFKVIYDALQDPSWVEAIQEELLQFKIQNVWTSVDCPKGVRPIGTKWVLKNKKDERGIVIRNKARLVAQGHTQEDGIDYDEVFSLVARIEVIRLFLAYASFMGFTMYQMDVKSAFLYGTIDKEVGTIDQTLFIIRQRGDFILVQVYVDDIIFVSSNPQLCREFKALMHEKIQMSVMGEVNFFIGLQVLQKEDGIFLSQDKYVGDILKKFGYSDVRSSNTPMDKENPWGKEGTGKDVDLHLYRSMIGSLMYLTTSRPDIMFAVCTCARHQVTPKECHLHAVKRIFRYQKGHPKLGLWYPKKSLFDLVAYSDSDYGGATQDRKSTTEGCQFLGRRLISWQINKQKIVATLTAEAEYVAAASCCGQVLDCFEKKLINVDHIHTDENVANLLTKPFDAGRFQYLVSEHNVDFHPIVDFVEASPLRIETTEEGTKILAIVDSILRTVTESSLRRNLKLQDKKGIISLPDTKLFENLTLMGYNISPNQKFTFQKGQFSHQWKYLIHTIMQCLSPKSTGFNEFSSNIATALVCLATNKTYNFSKMIFDGLVKNVNNKVSKFLMYPRRTRIAQSLVLPPVADEPASPLRDVSQGEAFPTDSGFIVNQDRATIAKTSTLPHDSVPRVTSLVATEGGMQQALNELTTFCTSLQRQHSELISKFEAQELEINKGRNLDEGEATAERVSDDTEEMAIVLTSMDAATVLATGVADVPTDSGSIPTASHHVPTGSGSIPIASPPAAEVPTGSDVVPTASLVDATATVVTPYRRRKGKEVMTQQRKPWSKKQKRDYYMAVIKSNLGWKVNDFRGMSFEEIEAKFTTVWKQLKDFIPTGSKEEAERLKGKVEWKLYDMCRVHQVTSKDKEIFMLVEKDYPLRKGLALVIIFYKLQVENYSQMANDLILKIYKIANSPRQRSSHCQGRKFPLPEEKRYHCQEDCTAGKIQGITKNKVSMVVRVVLQKMKCCKILHVTTLADKAILSGADNRPPMLEKDIVTRPKKYSELSATEAIQADCDVKATNIILQGLPPEERECKLYDEFDKFAYKKGESLLSTKFLNTLLPEWNKFVTDVKLVRDLHITNVDQLHAYLGQHEFHANEGRHTFLAAGTSRTYTSGANGNNSRKQRTVVCYNCKGEGHMSRQCTKPKRKRDESWFKDKVLLVQAQANEQILHEEELAFFADLGIAKAQTTKNVITHNAAYKADDLDAYDSDCDEINSAKVALMANLSYYGPNDLVEVHNQNNVTHNVINQAVQAMPLSEQSNIMNQSETKITNITPYSQYINLENKSVNETLTAELERYKDQVRILKEGNNVDKFSYSCAQSVEIDNLKQTLSENLKEKESLKQTITFLKNDFQKEESRNSDRELALEKTGAPHGEETRPYKAFVRQLFQLFRQVFHSGRRQSIRCPCYGCST